MSSKVLTIRLLQSTLLVLITIACVGCAKSEYTVKYSKETNTIISKTMLWFVTENGYLVVRYPNYDMVAQKIRVGGNPPEVKLQVLSGISDVMALSTPSWYSELVYAIKMDGTLWQAKNIETHEQIQFIKVDGVEKCIKAATGTAHTVVLTSEGFVYTWGANEFGQLGHGDTVSREIPEKVKGLANIIDIASGENHCIALDSGGKVYTWGQNNKGQIGDGSIIEYDFETGTANYHNMETPYAIEDMTNIVQVAAGSEDGVALRSDGSVLVWGIADYMFERCSIRPSKRKGIENIIQISEHFINGLALDSNGDIFRWGTIDYIPTEAGGLIKTASFPKPAKIVTGLINTIITYDGEIWQANTDGRYYDATAVRIIGRNEYAQIEKAVSEQH